MLTIMNKSTRRSFHDMQDTMQSRNTCHDSLDILIIMNKSTLHSFHNMQGTPRTNTTTHQVQCCLSLLPLRDTTMAEGATPPMSLQHHDTTQHLVTPYIHMSIRMSSDKQTNPYMLHLLLTLIPVHIVHSLSPTACSPTHNQPPTPIHTSLLGYVKYMQEEQRGKDLITQQLAIQKLGKKIIFHHANLSWDVITRCCMSKLPVYCLNVRM